MKLLAIDLGASSGRVMRVTWDATIKLEELHRFARPATMVDGFLVHDLQGIWQEIQHGIALAAPGGFDCIGVDSWGCDIVAVGGDGQWLAPALHYRDASHAVGVGMVEAVVDRASLYRQTGLQFLPFNTIYQLAALRARTPELLAQARLLLPMADAICHRLTGVAATDLTMASTMGLLGLDGAWDAELTKLVGAAGLLPELSPMFAARGQLLPEVCRACGCPSVPVMTVGGHDTASAVAAVPAVGDFVYLSAGTWSLVGVESDTPRLDDPHLTNERGITGSYRVLRNVMGAWLLQETRRVWSEQGNDVSFARMEQMAAGADACGLIDPDDERYAPPGDMPARIAADLAERGLPVPRDEAQVLRVIVDSLAEKHARVYRQLGGKGPIHMVGGGSQNSLLCRQTAQRAGVPVMSGPVEATVLGNAAAQAIGMGACDGLARARRLIGESFPVREY